MFLWKIANLLSRRPFVVRQQKRLCHSAGDSILAVDGTPVADLPEWDVINHARGPAGTDGVLTVQHPG